MKVYNQSDAGYEVLYRQCQEIDGVEYIGSIPQPQLAQELQLASVLAYPNTFMETSCIAVMEAMASGCWVVTSELGALPETTAGFARLIPTTNNWEDYKGPFVDETVRVLHATTGVDSELAEAHLRQQVDYANQTYSWAKRAEKWIQWLRTIPVPTIGPSATPSQETTIDAIALQDQARELFNQGAYQQAAELYEQVIALLPSEMSSYWWLGLALLLQDLEEDAQTTWLMALMDVEADQVEQRMAELVQTLQHESDRQCGLNNLPAVERIQCCIQQILEG